MRLRKRFRMQSIAGSVYNVDGDAVRRRVARFIGGSHPSVDRIVPRGEVWIERMRAGRRDERYLLAHELTEIALMKIRGWSYDRAHDAANRVEQQLRAGADPSATFARFVARHFPRAHPGAAKVIADALTRDFRRY